MSAQPKKTTAVALPSAPDGDDGPVDELVPGFDTATLEQVEDDEDLLALEEEGEDDAEVDLPDEADAPAAVPAGPSEPPKLVDQPTKGPTRKVKAAGLGGLLAAVPASLIAALDTITVPESVLTTISAVLTLAGALAGAYLAREREPQT
jgi:hypothetical protein